MIFGIFRKKAAKETARTTAPEKEVAPEKEIRNRPCSEWSLKDVVVLGRVELSDYNYGTMSPVKNGRYASGKVKKHTSDYDKNYFYYTLSDEAAALEGDSEMLRLEVEPEFAGVKMGGWYKTERGIYECTSMSLGGTGYGHPLSGHASLGKFHYNIKGQPLRGAPRILEEIKPKDLGKHKFSSARIVDFAFSYPEYFKLNYQQVSGLRTLMRCLLDGETYGSQSQQDMMRLIHHAADQFRAGTDKNHCDSFLKYHDGKDWWELQALPIPTPTPES